jgi:hypothetical protein
MPVGLFGAFGANVVFMRVYGDFTRGFFGAKPGLKWGEQVLGQYEDLIYPPWARYCGPARRESAGCLTPAPGVVNLFLPILYIFYILLERIYGIETRLLHTFRTYL